MCTSGIHYDIEDELEELEAAEELEAMGETCRNGKPWDKCIRC